MRYLSVFAVISWLLLALCAIDFATRGSYAPLRVSEELEATQHRLRSLLAYPIKMKTSWYGAEVQGRLTASGTIFDKDALTAAHPTLPFGTRLLLSQGLRRVVVTVTDRGPAKWTGRDLDVTDAAAQILGMHHSGEALLKVWVVED